jgi:hypothetical protein
MKLQILNDLRLKIIIFLFLLLLVYSCDKGDFTIGENFVEPKTSVILIDTFTVTTSTVLIDSMVTSGDSLLLIGNYSDGILGNVNSKSFFQIGLPDEFNIEENDIYDSISLCLQFSGYSYGDTTCLFSFTVNELIEELETDDQGYLYNTSSIEYKNEAIASLSILPHPSRKNSITLKLPDLFGKAIFDSIQNNSDIVSSKDLFLNYFKGLAIISNSNNSNSIIGFKATPENLKIRIYYHRFEEIKEDLYCDFPLTNNANQFNEISHDFSGTMLEGLVNQKNSLPSTKTNNVTFLLGGVGLLPKIQFPFLQEMMYFDRGEILKAELVIKPEHKSYSFFNLPQNLLLYSANKHNYFSSAITNLDGDIVYSRLALDELYNENTSYTFDISSYILSSLKNGFYDAENGLFISTQSSLYTNLITRLILECNDPAPKLKIYYAKF